jgi:hypothetical protein
MRRTVAGFLTRCLFSMFAEDVGLIPKGSFTELLKSLVGRHRAVRAAGRRAVEGNGQRRLLRRAAPTLPRFNGKLFKQPEVLPLTREQIAMLLEASKADWTQVEPAIFGTLLERALDVHERHALGAHYTPRAYVDRLVQPTVIEPLRQSWAYVQGAAVLLANEGKQKEAIAELRAFHHRLCSLRVLDPACGSGNFLYVALEHLKRLEGEVLNQLHDIGHGQRCSKPKASPSTRTSSSASNSTRARRPSPNWCCGSATCNGTSARKAAACRPAPSSRTSATSNAATRCWPATMSCRCSTRRASPSAAGTAADHEDAPRHRRAGARRNRARAAAALPNPRPAEWPAADVVVGNPPFIGASTMRAALGDGYVDALRGVWPAVPESADFVMFWWHRAAQLVAQGRLARFGFITTNSLRQTFNRRVVQGALRQPLPPASGSTSPSPCPIIPGWTTPTAPPCASR